MKAWREVLDVDKSIQSFSGKRYNDAIAQLSLVEVICQMRLWPV